MLNFDEERFLRIQSGAVGLARRIHQLVSQWLSSWGARDASTPVLSVDHRLLEIQPGRESRKCRKSKAGQNHW